MAFCKYLLYIWLISDSKLQDIYEGMRMQFSNNLYLLSKNTKRLKDFREAEYGFMFGIRPSAPARMYHRIYFVATKDVVYICKARYS